MAADIPDVKDFDDIEALDKAFKKAIAKADDADETELRIAHANARASFYEMASQRAALDVARRDALDKYPLAREWADEIRGDSPAAIEASAKKIQERLERMVGAKTEAEQQAAAAELAVREAARSGYGAPAAAGGGGTPPTPQQTREQAVEAQIHEALGKGYGLQGGANRMVVNEFLANRIRSGADAAIHNPSYRSITPGDKTIEDDRKASRGGRSLRGG